MPWKKKPKEKRETRLRDMGGIGVQQQQLSREVLGAISSLNMIKLAAVGPQKKKKKKRNNFVPFVSFRALLVFSTSFITQKAANLDSSWRGGSSLQPYSFPSVLISNLFFLQHSVLLLISIFLSLLLVIFPCLPSYILLMYTTEEIHDGIVCSPVWSDPYFFSYFHDDSIPRSIVYMFVQSILVYQVIGFLVYSFSFYFWRIWISHIYLLRCVLLPLQYSTETSHSVLSRATI